MPGSSGSLPGAQSSAPSSRVELFSRRQGLFRHSPRDYLLFAEATLALAMARLVVLFVPFQRACRLYDLKVTKSEPEIERHVATARAQAVAWAVGAATRRTPWSNTCLVQALAGATMLRRRAVSGTVVLGVRRDVASDDAKMEAHAWVKVGDSVLIGAAGHERYSPIAHFRIAPAPDSTHAGHA